MNIRKNDTVLVIKGKNRGKKGKVQKVLPREGRLLVEGVNMIKRHLKAQRGVRQAGVVQREAPIAVANVMLLCSKGEHPARLGFKFLSEGKKVRVCRVCGQEVD